MNNSTTQSKTKMKAVSFAKGYWFYFEVDGIDIAVNGSAKSGRETVYVNDTPVSEKRKLTSLQSIHKFQHQGKSFEVEFEVTNIFTGQLVCRLFVNSDLYAEQTKAFVEFSAKSIIKFFGFLALMFLGGLIVGALGAFFTKYFFG